MNARVSKKIAKLKWLHKQPKHLLTQKMMKERDDLQRWYVDGYKSVSDDFGKMVIDALF